MIWYRICPSLTHFTYHNAFQIHLCCWKEQNFVVLGAKWYSIVYVPPFLSLSIDGLLGCSRFLAVLNNAVMNIQFSSVAQSCPVLSFCSLLCSSLHEIFPWYLWFSWSDLYFFPLYLNQHDFSGGDIYSRSGIAGSHSSSEEGAWQPTPGFFPGESAGTVEPGRLQSTGSQRSGDTNQWPSAAQQIVVLLEVLWKASGMFSTVAATICIPTNSVRGFPFLHILPIFICVVFDDSHLDRCEMISPCGFDLHFPDN